MSYDPDEHDHDFKIGDMVMCMQRCGYFFGQGGEAIRRGETRIVEWVDGGRIFTIEDPERYGPWDSESFVKIPENLTRKQIAKRIDILDRCEYSRVGVHISRMGVERNPLIQDAIDNLVGIMHGMGPYSRRRI
jgi:hypothetical protein